MLWFAQGSAGCRRRFRQARSHGRCARRRERISAQNEPGENRDALGFRKVPTRLLAGAGVAQVRKTPRKYGGDASGFGKRLGAGFATNAVKTTVEHGVAARLHEDLNYHRSTKHGVAPRLAHALTSTVVTRNTKNGKRTPAAGRIAGNAAAGAFTQGALAAGSGASAAGIGLAAEAGTNVVREFAPRRNRHPRKKK